MYIGCFLFPITISGLLGSLFDSFIGATVQAMYFCPRDQKETEKHPLHTCGAETIQIRGWKWLNNDWVNFACGAFGVLMIFLLATIMSFEEPVAATKNRSSKKVKE